MNSELIWMSVQLLLAGALGGIIGFEREAHGRPAGLRTHILVCLGSALFTIVSTSFGGRTDETRIAAQIVSGIGFLGAGTIIRQGSAIRGLTTAASLWTVAAIGMAVGAGKPGSNLVYLAIVASLIVFITLTLINRVERTLLGHGLRRDLIITVRNRVHMAKVLEALAGYEVNFRGIRSDDTQPNSIDVDISVATTQHASVQAITRTLASIPEVMSFSWD